MFSKRMLEEGTAVALKQGEQLLAKLDAHAASGTSTRPVTSNRPSSLMGHSAMDAPGASTCTSTTESA